VLSSGDANGQCGLAAVAGDLHVGQVRVADGTLHGLVVDFIPQLLDSLGSLAHNRLNLLCISRVQLIPIIRTHQSGGIGKRRLLETSSMTFNDRGGQNRNDICKNKPFINKHI